MNISNPGDLIEIISSADIKSLIIVSLIALPILLGAWIYLLTQLQIKPNIRLKIIYGILGFYVIGLIVIHNSESESEKLRHAESRIIDYLDGQNHKMIGFGKIKDQIDPSYHKAFLEQLADLSEALVKTDLNKELDTVYHDSLGLKIKGFDPFEEKRKIGENKIYNFLKSRGWNAIEKDSIRLWIDRDYDNDFIHNLVSKSKNIIPAKFNTHYDGIEFTNLKLINAEPSKTPDSHGH